LSLATIKLDILQAIAEKKNHKNRENHDKYREHRISVEIQRRTSLYNIWECECKRNELAI